MQEVCGERAQGRDVRGEGERVVVAGVGSPLSQVHKIYAPTHITIHTYVFTYVRACVCACTKRCGVGRVTLQRQGRQVQMRRTRRSNTSDNNKLYESVHTRMQARANGPNRPKTAVPAVGHHGSWAGVAVPRKEVTVTPAGGTYGVVSLMCMRACTFVCACMHTVRAHHTFTFRVACSLPFSGSTCRDPRSLARSLALTLPPPRHSRCVLRGSIPTVNSHAKIEILMRRRQHRRQKRSGTLPADTGQSGLNPLTKTAGRWGTQSGKARVWPKEARSDEQGKV